MHQVLLTRRNSKRAQTDHPPLSHSDILLVISINDMYITHLNKYIKNTLK